MSTKHTHHLSVAPTYALVPRFASRPFLDANGTPVKIGATYRVKGLRKALGIVRVVRLHEPVGLPQRRDNRAPDTVIVENHGGRFPVTTAGLVRAEPPEIR